MNSLFKKKAILLLFIVFVAGLLRFWQLGQNPPSLTWDEVAWGYNAYSLGVDGRDEFGKFLPLSYLESFGDYKPPMYAYLDIFPVKIFGLNEFATRFPSAFLGVLTVLLTYFLVKRIFYESENGDLYALIGAGMLAISPWHIMLSRAAFEANVATFFIVFAVLLFLKGVQDRGIYLIFSVLTFVFSVYTFNTARVVSPLLLVIFAVIFWKKLFKLKKESITAIFVGIIFSIPFLGFIFSPQASTRFKEVNIFSDVTIASNLNQDIKNDGNTEWSKIIHNWRFGYGRDYLKHYLDNLNPNFLFVNGDANPKFSVQDVGELYFWEFPFLIIGVLFLFRRREKFWWIVPLWLILGIVPAASARETPHALRTEAVIPTFQILVAYGIVTFVMGFKKYKKIVIPSLLATALFGLTYFLHDYYVHYPYIYSREWQDSYKDSVLYVNSIQNNYDLVYVTNDLERGYIYFLFYLKTDPKYFRQNGEVVRDQFGFVDVKGFGRFHFSGDFNDLEVKGKKILYINNYKNVPTNAKILRRFNTIDGKPTFVAYEL